MPVFCARCSYGQGLTPYDLAVSGQPGLAEWLKETSEIAVAKRRDRARLAAEEQAVAEQHARERRAAEEEQARVALAKRQAREKLAAEALALATQREQDRLAVEQQEQAKLEQVALANRKATPLTQRPLAAAQVLSAKQPAGTSVVPTARGSIEQQIQNGLTRGTAHTHTAAAQGQLVASGSAAQRTAAQPDAAQDTSGSAAQRIPGPGHKGTRPAGARGVEQWAVDKVVGHKNQGGKVLYLTKWVGYGEEDNTVRPRPCPPPSSCLLFTCRHRHGPPTRTRKKKSGFAPAHLQTTEWATSPGHG